MAPESPIDLPLSETPIQGRIMTRYRMSEDPNYGAEHPRREIVDALDFHSTEDVTYKQIEIEGQPVYIAHTKPVKHVYKGGEPMLIDALVTGDYETTVRNKMHKIIEASDERRLRTLEYLKDDLLPQLQEVDHIVGIMGRGDTFDEDRVTTSISDLDLMLFVDFPLEDMAVQYKLIEDLMALKYDIDERRKVSMSVSVHRIKAHEVTGGEEKLINPSNPAGSVSYDLVSLPEIEYALVNYPDKFSQQAEYTIKAFTQGPIVMDSENNDIKKLQERLRTL